MVSPNSKLLRISKYSYTFTLDVSLCSYCFSYLAKKTKNKKHQKKNPTKAHFGTTL